MLKCKKYVPFFGVVLCFCVAILLFTGIQAQAENERLDGARFNSKLSPNENNLVLSQTTTGSGKSAVSDDSDENQAKEDTKAGVEEEQDLMENALELLEMADNYWKKGDIENTLNELDKAYALVLDTNGDVEIARQKDDLRLLISRRILAVYSSQETRTNGKASEILLSLNADVEKEIRSFQGPEREFFISSYHRSGMYKEIIVGELKKAGVPEELFWLPLVESGFKVGAYSRARALGLWQFIPSTGYKFGLTRDEWVDERMDVLKSTHAAIAYLKELHGMFGDWMTVLASYNCGEGRVLRVISRQHINYFDRFWDLYSKLPNETARYVPRFLATLHIIKNPEKYGFDLKTPADSLMNYETVKVNKMMKLSDVASKLEASEDIINILNAELRYKVTPSHEYTLKIPKYSTQKFNLVYSDIPETERPAIASSGGGSSRSNGSRSAYIKHRVRPGENVASIAKRYRVSRQSIFQCNHINKKKRLTKGRIIRIPIDGVETASVRQKTTGGKNIAARKTAGAPQTYKVKKGDSLLSIANKFNVPVAKLKKMNNLKTNSIQAGRKLKISYNEVGDNSDEQQGNENSIKEPVGKKTVVGKKLTNKDVTRLGTNKHIVTKGESLSIISRKYKIEMAKLIQMNNLSDNNAITPGQVLVVK